MMMAGSRDLAPNLNSQLVAIRTSWIELEGKTSSMLVISLAGTNLCQVRSSSGSAINHINIIYIYVNICDMSAELCSLAQTSRSS